MGSDAVRAAEPAGAEPAAAAERERLRVELDEARKRERRAVEERDRLAAETEAARLAEEERRRQDAEHAAEHERASAADATRHQEELDRTEAAAASAAEAARLETQRVLISEEVDQLKAERRRLEAELQTERDASPARSTRSSPGRRSRRQEPRRARRLAGERLVRTGRLVERPGDGQLEHGRGSRGRTIGDRRKDHDKGAAETRRLDGQPPGAEPHIRRGPRLPRQRVACRARSERSISWAPNFHRRTIPKRGRNYSTRLVVALVGVAVATVFIAVSVGLLIEQYVPPLRTPQGDVSRWLVVLVLGLTLGPLSLFAGMQVYLALTGQSPPEESFPLGQVTAVSILAYLLAEMLMGRGKSSTTSR